MPTGERPRRATLPPRHPATNAAEPTNPPACPRRPPEFAESGPQGCRTTAGRTRPGPAGPGLSEAHRTVCGMSERDSWRRPLTAVLATAVGMWTVTVAVLAAAVGWLAGETELELRSRPVPGWVWLIVAGSGALLAGVPALLLASVPRAPSARAAGRAWALAAVLSGVLGALRALVPSPQHELYLLVLAVVAGVGALLLSRGRPHSDGAALTAG